MNLNEIYSDPELGFRSADKFYRYIRTTYPESDMKLQDIENFLKTKQESQLYKLVRSRNL